VIYKFIEQHARLYPVEKMCKYLLVSRSSYYSWIDRSSTTAVISKKHSLKTLIRVEYDKSYNIYGSPRITQALNKKGVVVCKAYVARLMQEIGIKSVLRKKFVATTDSKHSYLVSDNLLKRDFKTLELGKRWVSDITYLKVGNRWAYLTTMLDLADRKIIGWSLSKDMTMDNTVLKAWNNARMNRSIDKGFILHSDRGIQYACNKTKALFKLNVKAKQSMSRKGDCWDNAVAESFFKTIKYEWIYRFKYQTYEEAYLSIWKYIEWYNKHRMHSSLGYKTPTEMEDYLRSINTKNAA
jgi:putative transposase